MATFKSAPVEPEGISTWVSTLIGPDGGSLSFYIIAGFVAVAVVAILAGRVMDGGSGR